MQPNPELGRAVCQLLSTAACKGFQKIHGKLKAEGSNSIRILGMATLFSLAFNPLFSSLLLYTHAHGPIFQRSLEIRSLWSITQDLSDKYVSRASCNSTHQRGMLEKHMQLLEYPSKKTLVMNILKKHVVYSTVNAYIAATSTLRCPVLYISISDLFSKHFLFPVCSLVCVCSLQSAVNRKASVYFERTQ